MKKTITQWSMVVALTIGSLLNAQTTGVEDDKGRMGVNTNVPRATLDVQPSAENLTETATTNEGIIPPKISKTRLAQIANDRLVEGTIVYIDDVTYTVTPANEKVKEVTEKGYYVYNSKLERWVTLSPGLIRKAVVDKNGYKYYAWRLNGNKDDITNVDGDPYKRAYVNPQPLGFGAVDLSRSDDYWFQQQDAYDGGATGEYSFAANYATWASGENSAAFGTYTKAAGESSFAIGYANEGSEKNIFEVGTIADSPSNQYDGLNRLIVSQKGKVAINKREADDSEGAAQLQVKGAIQSEGINSLNGSGTDKLVVADEHGVLKTINNPTASAVGELDKHKLVPMSQIRERSGRTKITGTAGYWTLHGDYWRYTGPVYASGDCRDNHWARTINTSSSSVFYITDRFFQYFVGYLLYTDRVQVPTSIRDAKVGNIIVRKYRIGQKSDGSPTMNKVDHWYYTTKILIDTKGNDGRPNESCLPDQGLVTPVPQLWYYDE